MAAKAPKTVVLYFYVHKDGQPVVSSMSPQVDSEGDFTHDSANGLAYDLCEMGLDMFGLKGRVHEGEVTRVTLQITTIYIATPRVVMDFAPAAAKKS